MVTLKLLNVRFNPHWKTTLRRCCEKLFIPLFFLITSLAGTVSLQAQDDSPCECVQRWEKGAHWNEDGTIDDAPNAPSPLGVIRCANAAETQSQIKPNGCTYNPSEFLIDVSGSTCIDPSTGATVTVANPTEGEPIIWFNFDARAHASHFEVQINDNAKDNIGFALYYSSTSTTGLNENGVSGDCSSLILIACGVESSNTWNTLPIPDFAQATNYYLAIWDQDADGDLKVNNFKARLGCSEETETPDCSLDLIECPETAKVSCGDPIDPISLGLPFDPEHCSGIEIDYSDVLGGICAENITIKRLWTFKDQSGNTANCEQLIEFVDETHPLIEAIADYTLEDCESEWPELSTEWSDNCGSGGQVEGVAGEVMVEGCIETRVYTFTVSDDCGNETTSTTTVTRKFDELVIACPADKTMEACATQAEIDAAFTAFLEAFRVKSGCQASGSFEAEYTAPDKCGGIVSVSYTATADCGDPQTCTATFTITECTTGDCGDCPEACAISGDQEVCPGELVAYSVSFENGCDSPEVIWSLSEAHDGATIVSEDASTNSVVLKIDNDCEGWIELIATIKCEGCEDVVCTYPIDIALTELVLDCPADKELEACSSQEDIDAAFKSFLESFGFEGGCDASGSFDDDYSAPDKCGGIVAVKYTVTESCGESQTCSATFSIGICEDGSCNTCEGSCLIGGDIAACPSEELVYTLDLDGVCAEPEIIWTLDGDAEIVETGEGQVTVRTTVDCEGWFTLKATINCDNCPPVYCEKTVDVVRHKLVLDCPDDIVVGECLSESEVQTAFADFLAAFSFSGGCGDGSGGFEIDYSAPEACGESVTVKYIAMDNCGQYETCSATFSISACDQECTPEVKDLEDVILEECGAAWPTLETEWWDDCGNDGKVLGVPGEVVTIDDCYEYRVYTFTLFNDCGEDAQTTTKVTRRYDVTPPVIPVPNLNIDLVTCIDEIPAPEDLKLLIEHVLLDNCDDSPDINITADGTPECIDGVFSFTYTVKVCDECGNCDEIAVTYGGSCEGTPGDQLTFCTLTQGGWGNPGGRYLWKDGEMASTKKILTGLMGIHGDVVIGDVLANTLQITDPECILTLLPGGGNPDVLPEGNVSASDDNDCTPYSDEYLTGSGRLKNTLASQTIVLQLNSWYTLEVSGADLGALTLESLSIAGTEVLPDTVNTVAELLAFANLYLGGTVESENELAGALTELLAAVNEFFDGCREVTVDACGLGWELSQESEEENIQEEEVEKDQLEMASVKPLKVWPNPASKQLTLNFYADDNGTTSVRLIDPSGKRVFNRTFPVTKGTNTLIVPVDEFPTGIYTIITVQGDKQFLERVVITKR